MVSSLIGFLWSDASGWFSGINLPIGGGLASTHI